MAPWRSFGRNENEVVAGAVDTNGLVTLEVPCISGKVSYGPRDANGYYPTYSEKFTFTGTEKDRWQPWNPTVKLVLKRVVNPVPLYAKHFFLLHSETIPKGKPISFDLMKADWVTPFGKGATADFILP